MEALAHRLAKTMGASLHSSDEQIAVMAYGLTALLQLLLIFLFSLLFGLLFGFLPEAMIAFFSVGFLRRLIGGAHMHTFNGCLIFSIVCVALFAAVSRYLLPLVGTLPLWLLTIAVYLLAAVLIYRLAPVESPNKPIRSPEKKRRLRRSAFLILLVFAAVSVLLLLRVTAFPRGLSLVSALNLSVLWQVLMLTRLGHALISVISRLRVAVN